MPPSKRTITSIAASALSGQYVCSTRRSGAKVVVYSSNTANDATISDGITGIAVNHGKTAINGDTANNSTAGFVSIRGNGSNAGN